MIVDNTARYGGGSANGNLTHCTIVGNSAGTTGGGFQNGTLKNCISWGNTASTSGNNWYDYPGNPWNVSYCCTTPEPVGTSNITDNPLFVSATDFRLQAGSPCIDAGINLTGYAEDFYGTVRPLDGDADGVAIADIGIHEVYNPGGDTDGDGLTDGLESDTLGTSMFNSNTDGDYFSDYAEYVADTDGADSNSYFCATAFTSNCIVSFDSSDARQYTLQFCTSITDGVWSNVAGQVDIMGSGSLDTLSDPAPASSPCYYRVKVEIP